MACSPHHHHTTIHHNSYIAASKFQSKRVPDRHVSTPPPAMPDPPPTEVITPEAAASSPSPAPSPSFPFPIAAAARPRETTDNNDAADSTSPLSTSISAPPEVPAPAASAPVSTSFRLRRTQSRSQRINDILEAGRERAETMGTTLSIGGRGSSGASPGSPALLSRAAANDDDAGATSDELTGILDEADECGYHATATTHTSMETRSRRPAGGSLRAASATLGPARLNSNSNLAAGGPANGRGAGAQRAASETPWYKAFAAQFRSIELENKGSVARDHLALERTFLAWLRTSLAFASIGIAVTQLFRLNTSLDGGDSGSQKTLKRVGKPLGATFLSISILILFLGYNRYIQGQKWVMKGKFPASRGTIMIVSFVALGVMVASLVVVVITHPSSS